MTCIAGYATGSGEVVIGGDSMSSNGYNAFTVRAPKVFVSGPMVVGYTTSFRFGQIAQHHVTPSGAWADMTALRYLICDYVPKLREALKEHGFATKLHEQEEGGTLLVGLRGQLFKIQSDYSVLEVGGGIDACGSGQDVAIGAMWGTIRHIQPSAEEVVRAGLEAASNFTCHVRAPFTILHVRDPLA